MEEEKWEALLADRAPTEHVRKWVSELPGTFEFIPLSCSIEVSEVECDESQDTVRTQELQPGSSGDHRSSHNVSAPVDPVSINIGYDSRF